MFKIIILSLLFASISAQNWCTVPYCQPGTHVACNHSGAWAGSCNNPVEISFTSAQIQSILNEHNTWRNNAAAGTIVGFQGQVLPSATRMARMQWNSQLAQFASLNIRQCAMRHDSCRGSSQFNFAGQNLAMSWTTGTINPNTLIVNSIRNWAEEHRFTRVSDIQSLQGTTGGNGEVIGHFTAVVNEKMTHVGCAMATFRDGTWNAGLFACNYAFTNFLGRRVYQSGATASQCITGRDSVFTNLCTIDEPINVNDWNIFSTMTMIEF